MHQNGWWSGSIPDPTREAHSTSSPRNEWEGNRELCMEPMKFTKIWPGEGEEENMQVGKEGTK